MSRLAGYGGDVYVASQLIHNCEAVWSELIDGDVTESLDTDDYRVGNGSFKMVVDAAVAAGDILATDDITSVDITDYDLALLWVKSSVNTNAGDLHLLIDETANCAGGDIVEDIPALAAGVWKLCRVPITSAGLAAIISVGIEMEVDKGAFDLNVDEIRLAKTVAGIKSWTIDYSVSVVDTTGFDNAGWKSFLASIQEWSGSFEGFKDGAPLAIGTITHIEFRESSTATQQWRGTVIITGLHPSTPVDGVVTYSYDFVGIHNLELATA